MTRPRLLHPLLLLLPTLAAASFAIWGLSEQRRARAHASYLHSHIESHQATITRLEAELSAALAQRDATLDLLRDVEAKSILARKDRLEVARQLLLPPPEDARLALEALNRCLAADGHSSIKAIGARAYEANELKDIELLEVAPAGLHSTFHAARRLALELDRERGSLLLRLHDGASVAAGQRTPFPAEGLTILLPNVYGPMWERELPYLVRPKGDYPEPRPPSRPTPRQQHELTEWRERLNALLERAGGELRWRVDRLGAIGEGGEFHDTLLLGYTGRRLTRSVEAARLRVVADQQRDIVALCCLDGVLREKGGEVPLAPSGWRLLVPGVTARSAHEAMRGFVAGAER